MDENYLFYSIYKNQITDIVTLITEIFKSVMKLEVDQIKSLVFSSDKRDLTIMTILTLKHLFKEERAKEVLDNTRNLKDKFKANIISLEKIVKLLAPLKEEKISLYYNLIKTISSNDKTFDSLNKSSNGYTKKTVYQGSNDQQSIKNENHSTHCSLTSHNIFLETQEQTMDDQKASFSTHNQSQTGSYSSFKKEKSNANKPQETSESQSHRKQSKKSNNNYKMEDSLVNDANDYNYLKMFETSKYPSNNLNYLSSTAINTNNISTNSYSSCNNYFNENFSTNSTINEKTFNSWGYSNKKTTSNQYTNYNTNTHTGLDIDLPDPLHYKDIFNSKN